MTGVGPPMRRRQLGRELRQLRETAGLRREVAANALDCSESRISHIETGRYGVRKPDLEVLLRLYGAQDRHEQLEEMRRQGTKRGWWSTYRLPDWLQGYIGLEDDAVMVRSFALEAIPGLLQTEAYARVLYTIRPRLSSEEIDRRVAARMKRQTRLTAPDPLALSVVISEAALVRTLALGAVGIEQLDYLAARGALPDIALRVLSFASGAHPSMSGSFTLLDFAPGVSTPIAYQEYAVGGHLVDELDDVQELSDLHDQLRDQALSQDESLVLISELTQRAKGKETPSA